MGEKVSTEEIRRRKSLIRSEYKNIRGSVSEDERRACDGRIRAFILGSMSYRFSRRILTYCSFGSEPDTLVFAEKALSDGKALYMPKTYKGGVMKFFRVYDLGTLKKGNFGVYEPDEGEEYDFSGDGVDLCIVPGLCFDKTGCRIGYGKGYYDRFLSKFKGISAGIAYSKCVTNDPLPFEKRYDKHVDLLITERGIETIGKKKI